MHFHIDYLHFPLSRRRQRCARVTTLHGRLDLPDLVPLYRAVRRRRRWSRSRTRSARRCPGANWQRDGLPRPAARPATVRRASARRLPRVPRPHLAREARRPRDRDRAPRRHAAEDRRQGRPRRPRLLRREIEPLLRRSPLVEFVGEIGEREKDAFLGGARALLFPIDWPEPFGLVMIEAMACGTPVVAFRRGSVPEVIDDGVTGFVVDDAGRGGAGGRASASSTAGAAARLRAAVHAARMARDYVAIYEATRSGLPARRAGAGLDAPTVPPSRRRMRTRRWRVAIERRMATSRPRRASARRCTSARSLHEDRTTSSPPRRAPTIAPRAEARRHLRRVRPLRRHQPVGLGEQGSTTTARASCRAASCASAAARPLLLSSTVTRGQRPAHRRPDQPRPARSGGQLAAAARHAAPVCAPSSCGGALLRAAARRATTATTPVDAALALHFDADFADIFEVRGIDARSGAASASTAEVGADARGARATRPRRRRAAHAAARSTRRPTCSTRGQARVRPARSTPRRRRDVCPDDRAASEGGDARAAACATIGARARCVDARRRRAQRSALPRSRPRTSSSTTGSTRSVADLQMMTTETPHGPYPYAGVPWFSTPFGRDGIITALECCGSSPTLARGVLALPGRDPGHRGRRPSRTPSRARSCTRRAAARWRRSARSRSAATTAASTRRRCS